MHILVPASADGYDSTMGCDYALIEIDIEKIEKRIDLLQHLRYEHEDIHELVFWGDAEFISDGEADRVFGHEYAPVPVRIGDIDEAPEIERTECDEVHVTLSGVWWSCVPKHTDVRVSTSLVSLKELKKLAEGE